MKFRYKFLLFIIGMSLFGYFSKLLSTSPELLGRTNVFLMWVTIAGLILFWFWPILKPILFGEDEMMPQNDEEEQNQAQTKAADDLKKTHNSAD